MTQSTKSKLEESMERRGRILFKLERDKIGEMIVYCNYHYHPSILFNGLAKECLEKGCRYAKIFRPEED